MMKREGEREIEKRNREREGDEKKDRPDGNCEAEGLARKHLTMDRHSAEW